MDRQLIAKKLAFIETCVRELHDLARPELLETDIWRDEYAQPARHIRASRSYDAGVLYKSCWADLNDDALEEVIINDRDRVWIFHSEA